MVFVRWIVVPRRNVEGDDVTLDRSNGRNRWFVRPAAIGHRPRVPFGIEVLVTQEESVADREPNRIGDPYSVLTLPKRRRQTAALAALSAKGDDRL